MLSRIGSIGHQGAKRLSSKGNPPSGQPSMSVLGKLIDRVLSGPDRREVIAQRLYAALTAQARRPDFYLACGVPDTIDGRFEMVALHAFLLFRRLKGQGEKAGAVAQSVYDVMFGDFDASVREMGAQDLGVGRRIKFMTEAMNGRFQAYEAGLAQVRSHGGQAELELALKRNVYGTTEPVDECLKRMADYFKRADAELAALPIDQLMRGILHFPPLEPDRLDY
jgi:cytochrome b pre-mRNA-processing protein 3